MRNYKPNRADNYTPHIHLKKRLGQHLLKDQSILAKIAEACEITPETTVLEVGAGVANLTEHLALRAQKVVAVELDEQFRIFHTHLAISHRNVDFVYEDILDLDLEKIDALREAKDIVIAGNIPYNITGPFIMKMLEGPLKFRRMVLMLQKEVVERLTAKRATKATNAFTLKVRYYCETEVLLKVPRNVFQPVPKVDSAVILFKPHAALPLSEEKRPLFFRLLEGAFAQKRKIILNTLSYAVRGSISREEITKDLLEAGIEPGCRAETVSLERFLIFFEIFMKRDVRKFF